MAVNPNTVIPVWINTWRPDFYVSITDKEDWAYQNPGAAGSLGVWQALFYQLGLAMTAYQGGGRGGQMQSFYTGTYGYIVYNQLYGTDGSSIGQFNSRSIYNMSNFVPNTLARPVSYYNDYSVLTPGSVNMNADISNVQGAYTAETSLIASRASQTLGTIQSINAQLLFKDLPQVPGSLITKASMASYYYNTLLWREAYAGLNTSGAPLLV